MKKQQTRRSSAEQFAWWCVLAVPVLIAISVSKIPLVAGNPITFNPYGIPKLFMLGVLVSIALVSWSIALATGQVQVRDAKVKWLMLGLMGLVGASTVFAVSPSMSLFGGHGQYTGLLTLFLCGVLAFLITQLLSGRERLVELTRSVMVGGLIVGGVGVFQAMGVDLLSMPASEGWMLARGSSTIGNPDLTGTYLVVPLIVAVALAFAERARGWRITALVATAVMGSALTLTLTRGAWIGALVGVVVLGVAIRRSSIEVTSRAKQAAIGVTGVAIVSGLLVAPQLIGRFTELASGQAAGGGRLVLWAEALKVIGAHPMLGTGPDGYVYGWWATHSLASVALGGADYAVGDPHNALLYAAATLGIPALLVALALIGVVLKSAAASAFSAQANTERLVFSGWWAGTVALLVALVFSVSTLVAMTLLWMCLGVLAAASARQREVRPWVRYAVTAICVLFAGFALVVVSRYLASDRSLAKELEGNREVNAAEAVARAPWNYEARYHYAYELYSQTVLSRPANGPQVRPLYERADQAARALIAWNKAEDDSYVLLLKLQTEAGGAVGPESAESALLIADAGLRNHPSSVVISTRKALALYALERYPEMVTTLQGVWDAAPRFALAGTLYAEALIATGDESAAAAVLGTLAQRYPGDPEVARVQGLLDAR